MIDVASLETTASSRARAGPWPVLSEANGCGPQQRTTAGGPAVVRPPLPVVL